MSPRCFFDRVNGVLRAPACIILVCDQRYLPPRNGVVPVGGTEANARGAETIAPDPKFWAVGNMSKNIFLVGKCSFKNAKFGATTKLCGNLKAKLKFRALIIVPCREFGVTQIYNF